MKGYAIQSPPTSFLSKGMCKLCRSSISMEDSGHFIFRETRSLSVSSVNYVRLILSQNRSMVLLFTLKVPFSRSLSFDLSLCLRSELELLCLSLSELDKCLSLSRLELLDLSLLLDELELCLWLEVLLPCLSLSLFMLPLLLLCLSLLQPQETSTPCN